MRDRLLAAVGGEQDRTAPTRGARPWGWVWQAAAAVILILNLAMSAANGFRYQSLSVRAADPADFVTDTGTDDRFWASAAGALARLTAAPDAGHAGRLFFELKEHR
jgi:hypothetical protein